LQTYFWRFTKSAYFGDPRISVQKFYSIEQAAFSTIITSFSWGCCWPCEKVYLFCAKSIEGDLCKIMVGLNDYWTCSDVFYPDDCESSRTTFKLRADLPIKVYGRFYLFYTSFVVERFGSTFCLGIEWSCRLGTAWKSEAMLFPLLKEELPIIPSLRRESRLTLLKTIVGIRKFIWCGCRCFKCCCRN